MMRFLPNALTLLRVLIIVPLTGCLFLNTYTSRWVALLLYTVASLTDFFDGYLARATGTVSKLGRIFDPIADKLLVSSVLLSLTAIHALRGLYVIAGLIILMREIAVSGLREFLAECNVSVPVTKAAKWKTFVQVLALAFLVIGWASPTFLPSHQIGNVLLWIAAFLTLVTGTHYLREGIKRIQ